eukprot:3565854-Rhodomonas_salina.1
MDVDYFMYEHDDYLVLFAAGNDGFKEGSLGEPSTNKNGLAVGSTFNTAEFYAGSSSKTEGVISDFSSLGPTRDGRIKPGESPEPLAYPFRNNALPSRS